ncbi:MAG: hypothetical protein ACRD5R_08910 [Candidatus Acidiferrales bacterium]
MLTLLPILLAFPVRGWSHFEAGVLTHGWIIALYAPLAMWMELVALNSLLHSYRPAFDRVTLAALPLGVLSLLGFGLGGLLFIFALPQFLHHLI